MNLLDEWTIEHRGELRKIELCEGDLTDLRPDDAVDYLVVSAFPNDYKPTEKSLIGALARKGISVSALADDKEVDLRQSFCCWLSRELKDRPPGIEFKRLLCFEPLHRGRPAEVVSGIFQSLAPFVGQEGRLASAATPLVATGSQKIAAEEMLPPFLHAAVHWMTLGGLPLTRLKLFVRQERAAAVAQLFHQEKQKYANLTIASPSEQFSHDVLVSYSRKNSAECGWVLDELKSLQPDLRVFQDQVNLLPGVAWQQELYEALDASRNVIALLSPPYLTSQYCKEEFNIAHHRGRSTGRTVLCPFYLYEANLPTYISLLGFADCRNGDEQKVRAACRDFVERCGGDA